MRHDGGESYIEAVEQCAGNGTFDPAEWAVSAAANGWPLGPDGVDRSLPAVGGSSAILTPPSYLFPIEAPTKKVERGCKQNDSPVDRPVRNPY